MQRRVAGSTAESGGGSSAKAGAAGRLYQCLLLATPHTARRGAAPVSDSGHGGAPAPAHGSRARTRRGAGTVGLQSSPPGRPPAEWRCCAWLPAARLLVGGAVSIRPDQCGWRRVGTISLDIMMAPRSERHRRPVTSEVSIDFMPCERCRRAACQSPVAAPLQVLHCCSSDYRSGVHAKPAFLTASTRAGVKAAASNCGGAQGVRREPPDAVSPPGLSHAPWSQP